MPLALAFGEQSGLGPAAGLYGSAFIGFFAALFGGTPTQISGPTAPMTALSMVVIAGLIAANQGSVEAALPIILTVFLLAGLFQVLLGLAGLGSFIKYIPYPVVSGFMSGIGVIILITQIPAALGYNAANDLEIVENYKLQANELLIERILEEQADEDLLVLENLQETLDRSSEITSEKIAAEAATLAKKDSRGVIGTVKFLGRAFQNVNQIELALCLITIFIIYGFKRITKAIPSTLVALLVVSVGAIVLNMEYLPIKAIPSGIPKPQLNIFTDFNLTMLLPFLDTAIILALLGAIDSLLTSVVADNMTRTQHNPNRELIGQGIGNSVAALFAGLPGAGATIRTVVNIQAGGVTKISGMVAGLLLFVIIIVLGPLASKIPAAVLAGILITVGFGVMDYRGLKALPKMNTAEAVILVSVLLMTVFWQLVYAVAVGLVMAAVVFLKRMSDVSVDQLEILDLARVELSEPHWDDEGAMDESVRSKVLFKHLDGPLFFGMVTDFKNIVNELGDINILVIRMERVPFIDQSGLYALEAAAEQLRKQGVIVSLCGTRDNVDHLLRVMHVVPYKIYEDHVFSNFQDCRAWLRSVLLKEGGLKKELERIKDFEAVFE